MTPISIFAFKMRTDRLRRSLAGTSPALELRCLHTASTEVPPDAPQTSRFHGVRRNKRTSKYEAYIRVQGRHVHLGCHCSEGVSGCDV